MAHIFRPGIAETSTTTGTADMALGGRVYGALAGFFDVMSVGDTCDYVIAMAIRVKRASVHGQPEECWNERRFPTRGMRMETLTKPR